jgi:hypothetical protein
MPYRKKNDCVQVRRAGKWKNLKCYPGEPDKADAYLKALYANVKDAAMNEETTIIPEDTTNEAELQEATIQTGIYIEPMDLSEAQLDPANRTVQQVIIRAGVSKNKRYYSEALLQTALLLFEGVKTYANHPQAKGNGERSVRELTGWIDGVEYQNGNLTGRRHFLRTQAGQDSWAIVEDIVNGKAPASLMGASINAIGKGKPGKMDNEEVLIVESIEAIHSVDDVTNAAAGGGWEQLVAGGDELQQQLFAALDYQEYLEARPDYVDRLKREWKLVRLGDATKTALAESDKKVKDAKQQMSQLEEALQQARAEADEYAEVNTKLLSELQTVRRELAVTDLLERNHLPAAYKKDLRERLPLLEEAEWDAVLAKEMAKIKASGTTPRVQVRNASAQTADTITLSRSSPVPLEDENVEQWLRRREQLSRRQQS